MITPAIEALILLGFSLILAYGFFNIFLCLCHTKSLDLQRAYLFLSEREYYNTYVKILKQIESGKKIPFMGSYTCSSLQVCDPDKFVILVLDNEYMFLTENFKNDIHSLSIWKTNGELVMGGYFGLVVHDLFYKAGYTDEDKEKCMQEDFESQQASINRLNEMREAIKNIEEEIKKLKESEE